MRYEEILDLSRRCESHPDHDLKVTNNMIIARLQEEIEELRTYIEKNILGWEDDYEWQSLTDDEYQEILKKYRDKCLDLRAFYNMIESKLKEKNEMS